MADVTLKIKIPSEKVADFRKFFLAGAPKPPRLDGEPMSDLEWRRSGGKGNI